MAISGIGSSAASLAGPTTAARAGRATRSPTEEFLDYARMSPAERMRAQTLSELGLREDDMARLGGAARDRVETAVRERIRDKVQGSARPQAGMLLDVAM